MASTETPVPAEERRESTTDGVSIIAHRGFAGVYPENTPTAMRRATRDADAVELDVMPTRDGEVVVFHDEEPGRLTDAPPDLRDRKVWEWPYEDLRCLEVLDSGETVPRLSAVLDAVPADITINVELKNPGTADVQRTRKLDDGELAAARGRWRPFVERVLETAADYPHDLLLSSFYEGALAAVRSVDPGVPLAAVFWDSPEEGLAIARRHDCEAVHLPLNMVAGTTLFNADGPAPGPFEAVDVPAVAHEEGRTVNVWTVRTWYQARELGDADVDGLIADYPGLLRYGATDAERGEAD